MSAQAINLNTLVIVLLTQAGYIISCGDSRDEELAGRWFWSWHTAERNESGGDSDTEAGGDLIGPNGYLFDRRKAGGLPMRSAENASHCHHERNPMKDRNEGSAHDALCVAAEAREDEAARIRRAFDLRPRLTPRQARAHEEQHYAMRVGRLRRLPTIFGGL